MSRQLEGISPYELTEEQLLSFSIPKFKDGPRLDDNLPEPSAVHLDTGRSSEWAHDLGSFELLPSEIQQLVLPNLDIVSLASFRLVNRKADLLFRAIPEYRFIATRFPKVLLAIQRTEIGRWITYTDLYNELHRNDCDGCGYFACFIYLLTCKRVCFLCFTRDAKYLPISLNSAHRKFGVSEAVLLNWPHVRCMPGLYSHLEVSYRRRPVLVDVQSTYQMALAHHGSAANMSTAAHQIQSQKKQKRGVRSDLGENNPYRYMAVISVPWINKKEQRLEMGVHCKGCRAYWLGPEGFVWAYQRKYSIQGFRDHIHSYGDIYKLDCVHSERFRHRGAPKPDGWAD